MRVATGGAGGNERGGMETVDIYTSHEALLLEYEEAFTRGQASSTPRSSPPTPTASRSTSRVDGSRSGETIQGDNGKYYNVSAHFVWIGDRTRQIDGAHVEYFRGIANPM